MLSILRVKNLALVEDLTLELQPGYNVITGETGAGKSILIGALNLALGERADRTLIRAGAEICGVEAVFDVSSIKARLKSCLEENGLEPGENEELVLKRTITTAGATRQFVNGSPCTLATLAKIGEWLVDIHGPHDHQSLLHPARQLDLLDGFAHLEEDLETFTSLLRRRAEIEAQKAALIVDEKAYAQQIDLLRFQAHEIKTADLQPDEEAQVQENYQRASNAARLLELSQAALGALGENENSVLSAAAQLGRILQDLRRVDDSTDSFRLMHEETVSRLRDLQSELSRYVDKIDLDPARLQRLEERLNILQSPKRQYG